MRASPFPFTPPRVVASVPAGNTNFTVKSNFSVGIDAVVSAVFRITFLATFKEPYFA